MAQSDLSNSEQEIIVRKAMAADVTGLNTIIVCFFTGPELPRFVAKMPRRPLPPADIPFNEKFLEAYREAITLNPAIHDGAVLVGRRLPKDPYEIVGWSYRLFPPPTDRETTPNKGAAFNSAVAMSTIESVDSVYLLSAGKIIRFRRGAIDFES
jgi:hypothetical protein